MKETGGADALSGATLWRPLVLKNMQVDQTTDFIHYGNRHIAATSSFFRNHKWPYGRLFPH